MAKSKSAVLPLGYAAMSRQSVRAIEESENGEAKG